MAFCPRLKALSKVAYSFLNNDLLKNFIDFCLALDLRGGKSIIFLKNWFLSYLRFLRGRNTSGWRTWMAFCPRLKVLSEAANGLKMAGLGTLANWFASKWSVSSFLRLLKAFSPIKSIRFWPRSNSTSWKRRKGRNINRYSRFQFERYNSYLN